MNNSIHLSLFFNSSRGEQAAALSCSGCWLTEPSNTEPNKSFLLRYFRQVFCQKDMESSQYTMLAVHSGDTECHGYIPCKHCLYNKHIT